MFIRIKDAVKKYGDGEAMVYALDHAELELEEGKICVILGPSGSGKSTLLNMLGGLDSLDSGELTVAGRNLAGLSGDQRTVYRKENVGFVFQFYNLIPDLTVEENRYGGSAFGAGHREIPPPFSERAVRRAAAEGSDCEGDG